jgi:hypothetical protein
MDSAEHASAGTGASAFDGASLEGREVAFLIAPEGAEQSETFARGKR